jgi:hypothetical protein
VHVRVHKSRLTSSGAKCYENLLTDENAARAEALILPELPGKTFSQVKRLAEQAAITVDPEAAGRRREDAEQNHCRVELFREDSGAAALAGRDLPTDQALSAHAHVCARAQQYKESGAFPGDTRMDQFRVAAYLDLLNGKPAETRIASGRLDSVTRPADSETGSETGGETSAAGNSGAADVRAGHMNDEAARASGDGPAADPIEDQPDDDVLDDDGPGHSCSGDDGPSDDEPGDGGPGDDQSGGGGSPKPPGNPGSSGSGGAVNPAPPRLVDLVLPLVTLLGLAERPGEGHALGVLDPDLCRDLAVAASGSPWTRLCVTVTDSAGIDRPRLRQAAAKREGGNVGSDRQGKANG